MKQIMSGKLSVKAWLMLLQFKMFVKQARSLTDRVHSHTHTHTRKHTSRSGELRTQKLKSHLVRTQSLNVLLLKPGVGRYIAMHATLTARDFFLISTLPVHSPAFFFQNRSRFLSVLAVVNTTSCVGPQNKTGHPSGCRILC